MDSKADNRRAEAAADLVLAVVVNRVAAVDSGAAEAVNRVAAVDSGAAVAVNRVVAADLADAAANRHHTTPFHLPGISAGLFWSRHVQTLSSTAVKPAAA